MPHRTTLGTARATLPSVCFPPGASASAAFAAPHINAVTRWFFSHGKWNGTTQQIVFKMWDNQITLPREVQTILSGEIRGVGDRSLVHYRYNVANEWYQFISGGLGISVNDPYDVSAFIPIGDGFVTFRDLPSAGTLKLRTTADEASNLSFHVRGRLDGAKVFTMPSGVQIEGETVAIPTSAESTITLGATFDELYSIVKPVTNGVLHLFHVADDLTQTLVGTYEPGEKLPCYRKYLVPNRGDTSDTIVARCKLRHVDAIVDNDEIIPGNLNALELGMQALGFRRNSDTVKMNEFIGLAIEELNADLAESTPEQAWGRIQIDPACTMAANLTP